MKLLQQVHPVIPLDIARAWHSRFDHVPSSSTKGKEKLFSADTADFYSGECSVCVCLQTEAGISFFFFFFYLTLGTGGTNLASILFNTLH